MSEEVDLVERLDEAPNDCVMSLKARELMREAKDEIARLRSELKDVSDAAEDYKQERDNLRSSLAIKDKALMEVEWGAWTHFPETMRSGPNPRPSCPACVYPKEHGHGHNCIIEQALSHTTGKADG
jgi:hypothetical protein